MTHRWLCPHCNILLGIYKDGDLEIRYKTVRYLIKRADAVVATCRKCGNLVKSY